MKYSPFRHISSVVWKRRPIQFTFFVTRRCNAGCAHCFYLSNGKGESKDELSLDEIERVSSSLGSLLWLAFSGGEIFLRDDIAEIAKIFYRQNRPAIILLPTNGLLPDVIEARTEKILKYCEKSSVVVKLSIDGIGAENDALRGVNGAFEKTMQTYELMKKLQKKYPNMELGVNTVFTSANQGKMDDIIRFVSEMNGVSTHTVSLVRGAVSKMSLKDVDIEKYNETIKILEQQSKRNKKGVYGFSGAKIKSAQDIVQRRMIYMTEKENKKQVDCYAGRLTAVLTENGDLYPCESFSKKIGNVREDGYDVAHILGSRRGIEAIREISSSGCFCTHECYAMMNVLFNPVKYPSLAKEYIKL